MASGNPFDMAWHRPLDGSLALDARINFFTNYYSWSPGMVSQIPGKSANYMVANFDGQGVPLSGSKNYKLHLPPNVPAANFWSVTLYDAEHSSGLDNGQPFPSSVRATSRWRTATARSSSISARGPRRGRRRTGWPPFRAAGSSLSSGSTANRSFLRRLVEAKRL